ncbi:MAG: SDR family oxidoreductase [Planctomycetes bacterium]|nr:SDR family oxidoreductase [Planctomycetota bacterium]
MSTTRIALVTGCNRGIGLEICKELADTGVKVIVTARDEQKGRESLKIIAGKGRAFDFCVLDVNNEKSIHAAVAYAEKTFGHLDALVNNAAISIDGGQAGLNLGLDKLRQTIETNVYGPLLLSQAAVPLMKKNGYGRIVNLSSGMGQLNEMGAGSLAYRTSKSALNAITRILAAELKGTNILVNTMCPGWVRTDMGGANATRSVEQGADTAVWLATLPDDGPTGGFFRDRKPIPW